MSAVADMVQLISIYDKIRDAPVEKQREIIEANREFVEKIINEYMTVVGQLSPLLAEFVQVFNIKI